MKYLILEARDGDALEKLVAEYFEYGWTLHGGLVVAVDQGRYSYCQAMVKEVK